ncbi:MAG TPA: hypothetical protein VGC21_18945 [Telluria sp.]|jgi:type IV pilus assembly protein PilV
MKKQHTPASQSGSMLIEALIAILIFAVGILAIVGLQAATIRQTTDAKYRLDASFAANAALAEMWGDRDPAKLLTYAVTNQAVASLPNGKRTVTVAIDPFAPKPLPVSASVTVTITWQLPGEPGIHTYSTMTKINVT